MKRMLAQKFIDWVKGLFGKIGSDADDIELYTNVQANNHNIYGVDELDTNSILPNGDSIELGTISKLTANALDENIAHGGAIFQPINKETYFEVSSNLHASNLGTIARGYFKVKAASIDAGTHIYQTSGQALHDAILAGDTDAMPYTHLLCKVKGGAIFWLSMSATGDTNVVLKPNITLTAGMDCYVIAAVQSSILAA